MKKFYGDTVFLAFQQNTGEYRLPVFRSETNWRINGGDIGEWLHSECFIDKAFL